MKLYRDLRLHIKAIYGRFHNTFQNTFYFFRYAGSRYVKYLFTNTQKQQNILKINLNFNKNA